MSTKFVPESFKRKQQRDESEHKNLLEARKARHEAILKKRAEWTARARKYFENARKEERDVINKRREARASGNFYVAPEAKVAFVIRLKGINKIRPQVKKILRLFRLRQINNGVFIKINKATLQMLKRIEPYVTFGYPTRKTIADLIYKRGHLKVGKSRIPLTDNLIVEQNLGKHNIICVEDLIEEIHQVGPHFKEANNTLWPFKLNNPRKGWNNKNHGYQAGGDWGNREEQINQLVERMI